MPDIAECLQVRTHILRDEIEWIKAGRGEDPQAVLEHLRRVRSELSACGDLLCDCGFAAGGALTQRAGSDYRDCLQRLQETLPLLQAHLLAQRSWLQPEREQTEAALQWISRSKSTLG